jgi:hypothetical protein
MTPQRPFRLLLNLFQGRFFENEDVSPGGGFQATINQVLGFLVTTSFIVSYLSMPVVSGILDSNRGDALGWAIRGLQLFPPVYTFAIVGFTTFFEWNKLFPTRRDFLILAPFPVRLWDIFAAQCVALAKFLGLLIAAVNLFPIVFTGLLSLSRFRPAAARLVAAHIAAAVCVSCFAFFGIAAFQGVLLNVSSPRLFRRISPYIQMCGMSLMVLSILTYPTYMQLLKTAAHERTVWLWLFPPVWFSGLYDLLLPNPKGLFASLGWHGLRMLAGAIALFALTWLGGFRRHYRRTLEAEETHPSIPRSAKMNPAAQPEESALFQFIGKTLGRSPGHQFFLVTYLSIGVALAINSAAELRGGHLVLAEDGARAAPFLIAFFVISGFRAVFQFPAELSCNWIFRMAESNWTEIGRNVARRRVLASGLAPVLFLLLPGEIVIWGSWRAAVHILVQLAAGALLVELMFWTFDKVPFTCSYFPGRTNLSILFALYLYGFTIYSVQMASLELSIEGSALYGALFFAVAAALLVFLWRRHPSPEAARFDGSEAVIQKLDLT